MGDDVDFGIRAIIAESYADIFFSNACSNGLPAISLPAAEIKRLFALVGSGEASELTVDLQEQKIVLPGGEEISFSLPSDVRHNLLNGLDDIAISLKQEEKIRHFEKEYQQRAPWLFHEQEGETT